MHLAHCLVKLARTHYDAHFFLLDGQPSEMLLRKQVISQIKTMANLIWFNVKKFDLNDLNL